MKNADVFDQVTDNPGTSVQPSWLAEDVKSSLSLSGRAIQDLSKQLPFGKQF